MTGAILLQIVLIALNAVFASAEIAVISMNDAKLERLAKKGNKQAKRPEEDETVTEEEIRMMAAVGSEKGVIEADENEMIQNVLDFNDISVEELCTHRKEVVTLDMQDTLEIWEETARNSRHNYMPVCGKDTDDIIGVLDIRAFYRMDWRDADLTKERVLEQGIFRTGKYESRCSVPADEDQRCTFCGGDR